MRTLRVSALLVLFTLALLASGCGEEKDLRIQNETQRKRIASLESELKAKQLELDRLKRELETMKQSGGVETDALQQKIAALQADLDKKNNLLRELSQKVLIGGELPAELSTKLEDFAANNDMVEYNPESGVVKFKSDLLFEKGSDVVSAAAVDPLKALCKILDDKDAAEFNIVIAGYTDDIPIAKPETRAKHPTNWHLSAHRAISVLTVMASDGVNPARMSVRGFGEYRPVAPNKPGHGGNPANRRVEIYIVPKGV